MSIKVRLWVALLVSVPAFPQAVSPVNPGPIVTDDRMSTPPPVSGQAYPTAVLSEGRSNYISGVVAFQTSYVDNLYPGNGGAPISETIYSIQPNIDFDQQTSRRHIAIYYSPGFTFYQPTSSLNEVDENVRASYQVRMTPHSTLYLRDGFQDSSTTFNSTGSVAGGPVSGSVSGIAPGIIVPFAERRTNSAEGEFTLQTTRNSMIGASGMATLIHFPNPSEVPGVFDSNSQGGMGFYSIRLSRRQYLGTSYNYSQTIVTPPDMQSETLTHTISAFYTFYPMQTVSLSVSGGPQRYNVTQPSLPSIASWEPSVCAGIGWQSSHVSFAASYFQAVTAGGGLLGAYHSKGTDATVRWQISRTWTLGAGGSYGINKSVDPQIYQDPGGHSISGQASVEHSISKETFLQIGYARIHQSYSGIEAISSNPDSDRVSLSIAWRFTRPLGL